MAQVEKSVTFLGTPLQFVAIVSGLVFHDGSGDPINLPPFLDDLKRQDVFLPNVKTCLPYTGSPPVNPNGPLELDPNRQQIVLERSWHDELGHWVSFWTVNATGKGPDKADITIPCDGPNWAMIEEGWNWLVSELAARGRVEAAPAAAKEETTKKPRGRPTPSMEYKLEVWRKWQKAKEKGYPSKTDFCQQQDPPIHDTKTLNAWRDRLIQAGYLTPEGEIIE